jgi:betaine-aldehyde dehydrogenase
MTDAFYPPRHLYYDGQIQAATSGSIFRSIDPSTAQPLAEIHAASQSDVDSAVTSAQKAFPSWSTTPPIVRSRILQKAVHILRERNDEIARVETQDTGKPYSETSTVDIMTGADVLEFFANLVGGGGLNGETIQLREDAWVYTKKEALGVCAGIGAWNYPIQMYAMYIKQYGLKLKIGDVQCSLEVCTMSGCRKYHGIQTK